jgi:hypothetical protein
LIQYFHALLRFLGHLLCHEWVTFDYVVEIAFFEAVQDAKGVGLHERRPLGGEEDCNLSEILALPQLSYDCLLIGCDYQHLAVHNEVHLFSDFSLVDDVVAR